MRILTIHNHYGHYATGGEANVFEAEAELLERHGHKVRKYTRTNSEVIDGGFLKKIKAYWEAPWSEKEYDNISEEIRLFRPDLMHVHNFFLIISPSIFRAAKDAGVPTVTTLHNYRFLSPCSQLIRNGKICELCLNKNPWRIMLYRCYRNGFWTSLLRYRVYYSSKNKYHWPDDIDAFIALTQFGKDKFIEGGLPAERIYIKPNFIPDFPEHHVDYSRKHGALFVGRLSKEKGLNTLMNAWEKIDYPLNILGDGSCREQNQAIAPKNISFLGTVDNRKVLKYMERAKFLVFPSEWYEGFPCTLIESFSTGLPVIASNLGAMAEIIDNGRTGLLFEPGNVEDLRTKVQKLIENDQLAKQLGLAGRHEYLEKYTSERNYKMLMDIYNQVTEKSKQLISM